jgi:hypothetical protein
MCLGNLPIPINYTRAKGKHITIALSVVYLATKAFAPEDVKSV